jgi:hypothetical protein
MTDGVPDRSERCVDLVDAVFKVLHIRQHTSAYVSISQHTPAYARRKYTPAYGDV